MLTFLLLKVNIHLPQFGLKTVSFLMGEGGEVDAEVDGLARVG